MVGVNTTGSYYVIRFGQQGPWEPLGVYTDQGAKRRATMLAKKEGVSGVYVGKVYTIDGRVRPLYAKYPNDSNTWWDIPSLEVET